MTEQGVRVVGPWTLLERLGRGGNASVWKATRLGGETAALKVINANKVEREPYKRFVREIQFLRDHQAVRGLLPLLDAYLPDRPSRADQPWLAMPVATPISTSLGGRPLADVVRAIAEIADTLARLQQFFDIAHRDIKPGNLYELDGSWLIGDFGLMSLPGAERLTVHGHQVGPAHYTAYEMIINPAGADPHRADVYSLGKTLWVLATGQTSAPEGHQPAGTRGFGIGDFKSHPNAAYLDHEIDQMTRLHPEERPTKKQVAHDLAEWPDSFVSLDDAVKILLNALATLNTPPRMTDIRRILTTLDSRFKRQEGTFASRPRYMSDLVAKAATAGLVRRRVDVPDGHVNPVIELTPKGRAAVNFPGG